MTAQKIKAQFMIKNINFDSRASSLSAMNRTQSAGNHFSYSQNQYKWQVPKVAVIGN
jgi:hypothetical protein